MNARIRIAGIRCLALFALALTLFAFTQPASAQVDETTCGAFETAEDAQEALDSGDLTNPQFLDSDGDGIACEDAFGVGDGEAGALSTCDEFADQAEAQAFYDEASAEQQNVIDPDGDGVACEAAPGGDGAEETNGEPLTCNDFLNEEAAQTYFETDATPQEVGTLDPDADGLACEGFYLDGGTEAAQDDAPDGELESDGVSQLPSTGSAPAAGNGNALALLSGLVAAVIALAAVSSRLRTR